MLDEITCYWENTGILSGVSKEKKEIVAAALENQKAFNEQESPEFKCISIPVLRTVLGNIKGNFNVSSDSQDNYGIPTVTTVEFDAINVSNLRIKINEWIEEWCKENNKTEINFTCLGLDDNKIVIYGLGD